MNVRVKIQRKYGYIPVSSCSGSMIGILMKRMLARNCPDLAPAVLLAAADQDLGLLGAVDQDDPRLVQLGHEPCQVFDRDRLRPVLALERLLDLLQGLLAVELLEQEVLLDLEAKVLERERVLDDVVRHPLVELRLDDQVGPELDDQVFGGLPERSRRGPGRERRS